MKLFTLTQNNHIAQAAAGSLMEALLLVLQTRTGLERALWSEEYL